MSHRAIVVAECMVLECKLKANNKDLRVSTRKAMNSANAHETHDMYRTIPSDLLSAACIGRSS